MTRPLPKAARELALKHKVNFGRDAHGNYFVRDRSGRVVDTTASASPTAANALALVRRAIRRRGGNPGGLSTRVQAARGLFKSFTGQPGKPAGYVQIPDDDVLVIVGNCEAIAYNAVRGGTRQSYQHEFAKKSRPLLAVSSDGNRLYLIAGSYKFTERGIVDR